MRYARERERDLHQRAVIEVLAAHLETRGDPAPRGLTHTVSRALRAHEPIVSRDTLELFIGAFGMVAGHAEALRKQWLGADLPRVVVGGLPAGDGPPYQIPYQMTLLHEFHYVGADGRPTHHRSVRDIRSLVGGLTSVRYRFDTDEVTVDRISGGTPGEPYRLGSHWAVDIALPRTLDTGDDHTLEYLTSFRYKELVEPCFRRVAPDRMENVAIRVQFHPDKLPKRVWWAEWRDFREPDVVVVDRRPAPLDGEHAVYHRLDAVERAVVGFEWEL